ncbi:TfoX/Sxy family DNA transformation protein [Kiloniella laminariae]|uniref:TfoX/Sxy family DNA transformation protein n=1 Tax=Kiloniella laminariae TaxID=454162 RepID=A0ABT4LMB0_9PROT|nr:TfoX/Sxy family DNA transformation protein [Kiloniella laminariae]MCZ4282244.1 TfoX/Sxy family DNA transformation protein [Kiloniella laminariae]
MSAKIQGMQALLAMRNIGPKSVPQLLEVGITSPDDLRNYGAEETFRRLYFRFCDEHKFSLNYLYALEGANLDCDWRWLPVERKQELKEYFNGLKQGKKDSKV